MALGLRVAADGSPLSSSGGATANPIMHPVLSQLPFMSGEPQHLHLCHLQRCLLSSRLSAASLVSLLSSIFQTPLYRSDAFLPPFQPACSGLLTCLPQPPSLCTVGPENWSTTVLICNACTFALSSRADLCLSRFSSSLQATISSANVTVHADSHLIHQLSAKSWWEHV